MIAKNLESRLRQGLFQEPRIYEAWIRLSNGAHYDDRKPDAHGMAVKLMGVDGPKVLPAERDAKTQDFVLVDNPTFMVRECARVSPVLGSIAQGRGEGAFGRLQHARPGAGPPRCGFWRPCCSCRLRPGGLLRFFD